MTYQVEIQIIGLEVCESLVEGFLDVVGVVVRVPQFASDLKKLAVSRKYTIGVFLSKKCHNSRRSVREARPTSSSRFRPHSRSGSMQLRRYDGNPCAGQSRRRSRPRVVWRAIIT